MSGGGRGGRAVAKGKAGEREAVKLLSGWLPDHDVRRNLDQSRDAGADIVLPGIAIEVKRSADYPRWYRGFRQVLFAANELERIHGVPYAPVVLARRDGRDWQAVNEFMTELRGRRLSRPVPIVMEKADFRLWIREKLGYED